MTMIAHVRDAFAGADAYDVHARVQRHAAKRLARRIAALALPPAPRLLEIGCGTGFLTEALFRRRPEGEWLVTDVAPAMLARCADRLGTPPNVRYRAMDGADPVPAIGSFDLICSSFAFQWFADLPAAIARLAALLRPGGHLAFATMAADSLGEWRAAHRDATGQDVAMAGYPTLDALDAMAPPGFAATIAEQRVRETHRDARSFLASLRAIGAHRPREPRAPIHPAALRRAMAAFEAGGAAVTWHVAYAVLTRPEAA